VNGTILENGVVSMFTIEVSVARELSVTFVVVQLELFVSAPLVTLLCEGL
jgi:hypothetical protein